MEAIRKAISMPTLCSSDTVIPNSCTRRDSKGKCRKRRKNSRTKLKSDDAESKSLKEVEALSEGDPLECPEKIISEMDVDEHDAAAGGPTNKPASMSFVKLRVMVG